MSTTTKTPTPNREAWTAGPWHTGEGNAATIIYGPDGYAVANATVYHGRHAEQTRANARLIAAAPEMACLVQLLANIASDGDLRSTIVVGMRPHEARSLEVACDKARALLARVRSGA